MANEKNLRTPSTSEAREMQRKSAAKRSQNIKEKKVIREMLLERMTEKDWEEILAGVIDRAKENRADFETLRDTLGQKPTEKVETDAKIEIVMGDLEELAQ